MKEIQPLISDIENNVRKLIGQIEQLRKENEILKEESLGLRSENEALKQRLLADEAMLSVAKISELMGNQPGSESTRKKLNELIREIDKCILLLDE